MYAELITIGDEILIGQILDSNSAWMAQQLNDIGIQVKQITSIADQISEIKAALSLAASRADVILITGGLGPTQDDVTREALSDYFQSPLRRNETVLAHVRALFDAINRPLLEINHAQADVLECAEVLFNKTGTAPGMYIQDQGKHFFVMPGVPSEMKYLMSAKVIPILQTFPSAQVLVHRNVLTAGIGESFLALRLQAIEKKLPDSIQLAYLPAFGEVRLRLSGKGSDRKALEDQIDSIVSQIWEEVGEHIFAEGDATLEEALIEYLSVRGLSLSTAESCTGGSVARLLTLVPGSSAAFHGGVVAYTNAVKESVLEVPKDILEQYGAVSEQTVAAMAQGIRGKLKTDYAVATTGIAGPSGGSEASPVGTVWVGISGKTKTVSQRFQFDAIRSRTIERSSKYAIIALFKLLREENER